MLLAKRRDSDLHDELDTEDGDHDPEGFPRPVEHSLQCRVDEKDERDTDDERVDAEELIPHTVLPLYLTFVSRVGFEPTT